MTASRTAADRRVAIAAKRFDSVGGSIAAVSRAVEWGGLAAVLILTVLFASRAMAPAFGPGTVIQDDARQHVFWMARFRDPELFRDDLIADYYQSLAPPGYTAVYWAMSWVVQPLLASKILPPVLGVVAAFFTFLAARRLHPSPAAAFFASLLLSYYVWQYDDLVSAVPRAFVLPLLAALLWALVANRLVVAAVFVVLLGLFYPMGGALGVAVLAVGLLKFEHGCPGLTRSRLDWLVVVGAASLVGLILLQGQLIGTRFGPVVTAAEAHAMPDFGPNGRVPFFPDDPYRYWLKDRDSGFDLQASDLLLRVPVLFEYLALAALLPLFWLSRRWLASAARLSPRTLVLARVLVASFALFFLAHLLLFRLYLPDRYVKWSVPLVLAVAAGLALGILIDELGMRLRPKRGLVAAVLTIALALFLVIYPARYDSSYRSDRHPQVTAVLRTLPKDILIAGVPVDTDSIPAFAGRRVLTSREHTYPLHLGFNGQMLQRTNDLIEAYYADTLEPIAGVHASYGVTHFLVNRDAFQGSKFAEAWRDRPDGKWQPFNSEVAAKLQRSRRFLLLEQTPRCAQADDGVLAVLPTTCLLDGR